MGNRNREGGERQFLTGLSDMTVRYIPQAVEKGRKKTPLRENP
ncbi:hypothetical protein [Pelotomaculum terephthalicicum]|nr:hypothetical protein [Pelotomaculum terephthalicicum]